MSLPHAAGRQATYDRITVLVEWPMGILALMLVPALIVESQATSPGMQLAARVTNWAVWLAFCAEYLTKLYVAPSRARHVRTAWFDLLIIVLSPPFLVPTYMEGTRTVRVVRLFRLLRLLRAVALASLGFKILRRVLGRHRLHYVGAMAIAIIGMGAMAVFLLERGVNPSMTSVGDALWWAVVTATTVGYGDVSPVTVEGRVIAVALMVTGIGVIGAFTASVASFFLEHDRHAEEPAVEERLASIETKLDALLAQQRPGGRPPEGPPSSAR